VVPGGLTVRIDNPAPEDKKRLFAALDHVAAQAGPDGKPVWTRYLDLGTHVVRLVNYSPEFTPHVEKQLAYVLRDDVPRHDATLVVWKEDAFAVLPGKLDERCDPKTNLRARVEMLARRERHVSLQVFDAGYSRHHPLITVNPRSGIVSAHNPETSTWYYGVENLEPEEFIRHGHVLVQTFNQILKSRTTALVHGAAVSLNNRGVLFCARGQRGKSTLAVRAMLDGFDYVSDDYLVLGREADGLYAWPIYSIITLSPMMYGDLYNALEAKFVSNNGRKDKYVFNIAGYHDRFVSRCPIHLCMFTQIVPDAEPGVVACTPAGKGRAVTQLVHSTINQMGDRHDIAGIKKLVDLVKDLPFYQINLCRDTEKNLRCLREFLDSGKCGQQANAPGMLRSRSQAPAIFGGQ
jgi:hypothetical protein